MIDVCLEVLTEKKLKIIGVKPKVAKHRLDLVKLFDRILGFDDNREENLFNLGY